MRVAAVKVHREDCLLEEARFAPARPRITVGREYEVHAVSLFEAALLLQIVDDLGHPS